MVIRNGTSHNYTTITISVHIGSTRLTLPMKPLNQSAIQLSSGPNDAYLYKLDELFSNSQAVLFCCDRLPSPISSTK